VPTTLARVVTNGPDEALDKLQLLLMGALATCRTRVVIMTPYFLPNETLVTALMVAALRGVEVELVVPEHTNIRPMTWAMQAMWSPLVLHGVRVTVTPPPFDHSKVMVVDGTWVLVGSTNWDQRSLRLNFEANLECYDSALGAELEAYVTAKRALGRRISRLEVLEMSLLVQLRNRFVRLFASYL
jgi:cardiolipin synthase